MKFTSILILSILIGCSSQSTENTTLSQIFTQKIPTHTYNPQPLPGFFNQLFENHFETYSNIKGDAYSTFCEQNEVANDSTNKHLFLKIHFYHDLFTCNSATNGARGGILKIPYLWHWIDPNPRHEIVYLPTSDLLTKQKPPTGFSRYNSLADLDRTPDIFFKDLVTEAPQYSHPDCGTFHTFGWCSEREMAFVALLEVDGYLGKVVAQGNHSWSEFWVKFNRENGTTAPFEVRIDNTFDDVSWKPLEAGMEKSGWQRDFGEGKLPKWYNVKAHSQTQKTAIKKLVVAEGASAYIEKMVVAFFEE